MVSVSLDLFRKRYTRDGSAVTDAAQLHAGDPLTVQFSRGAAGVQVQTLLPGGVSGDEQD